MEPTTVQERTEPRLLDHTEILLKELKALSAAKIKTLMHVSDDIAKLNVQRYKTWDTTERKQALLAFDGAAYKPMAARTMSIDDLQFAQQHLRMLSGLYGVLRPLDSIQPYRLEMGCKLANERGKDLYAFWGDTITDLLNEDLQGIEDESQRFFVNCASQEYYKAVKPARLCCAIYTMVFPGPAIYAKQARGAMTRFAIINRITSPDGLKGFTGVDGEWSFDAKSSKEFEFVFRRSATKAAGKAQKPNGKSAATSTKAAETADKVIGKSAKKATGKAPKSKGKRTAADNGDNDEHLKGKRRTKQRAAK